MTVTIYHNPDCGTSRNVFGLIRNSGEEPVIVEYLKTPPARDVMRRKDPPYDALGLADPSLGDDRLLDTMMAHPILINRPIVVTPLAVKLCRPSETVLDILPTSQRDSFTKEDGEVVIDAPGNRILKAIS